jgi:hypothetical protein
VSKSFGHSKYKKVSKRANKARRLQS